MKVNIRSPLTQTVNTMDLPLTEAELAQGFDRHAKGELIQDIFPELTPDQREFLLTGIPPHEWDTIVA